MRADLRWGAVGCVVALALQGCGGAAFDYRVYKGTFNDGSVTSTGVSVTVTPGSAPSEYVFAFGGTDCTATLSGMVLSFSAGQPVLLAGSVPDSLIRGEGSMTADQLTFTVGLASASNGARTVEFSGMRE